MALGRTTLGYRPPTVVRQFAQPQSSGRAPTRSRTPLGTPNASYVPPSQAPWQPPPIPAGAYNPIRDIEENAGKRGLSSTLEDLGTREERGDVNFGLGESEVERQRGEQTSDRDKALATLKESYAKLGARQAQAANGAGLLSGGALLQAAAKRATNEGKQVETTQQGYQREMQADDRSLGRLALTRQQESQDDATQGSRAEREQSQFGIDTQTLEAREAAENGYESPTGVVARTSYQPGAGFVRIGGRPPRRGH